MIDNVVVRIMSQLMAAVGVVGDSIVVNTYSVFHN